jgi:transposase-like protein
VKLTLKNLADQVSDERDAYLLLEELRWHGTPICAHCGNDKAYFLNPKGGTRGTGPKDKNGKRTQSVRRVWKCAKCRRQFSVLTNTIFHGTKVSLRTWLFVMVQACAAKNGISAREIERMHGVTPETAWYMLHRLRESMRRDPLAGLLQGVIVADETYVGGNPKNWHESKRQPMNIKSGRGTPKVPVFTLVEKHSGEARSRVIPDVTGATLYQAIKEETDPSQSLLHTDALPAYKPSGRRFVAHETVDHGAGEYVGPTGASTNVVESYFSQLKRSIDGTHHHVSRQHLQRYVDEFDFRFSTRKLSDSARMERMIGQAAGRRLSYKPLTGR